ncbi:DUF4389 domain-containing protein [Streptomyces sp. TP-A0356]|uniref:DUF4389 domain-containing protein n=1 Tax=Streptomyces sp. TP-A0356 TaxID=1359208 RepID=UPI000AA2A43D|nr:DUF4389 domain-containing protein [Streptomyces sp. TP-A0356]
MKVEAELDEPLSRWLWLVKSVLLLPHHLMLTALGILFAANSMIAFFAILFTGRYPRRLFDFNTGALRWAWRVAFYFCAALGTDRYPPFSTEAEPWYPARLEIAYPERLSRGLVLVKSWLLLLPHYLIMGTSPLIFYLAQWWGGLIGLLVVIASTAALLSGPGAALLIRGRYPQGLFDTVIGFDRWMLRVAVYAALMTDEYPPLRIDRGGTEPTGP